MKRLQPASIVISLILVTLGARCQALETITGITVTPNTTSCTVSWHPVENLKIQDYGIKIYDPSGSLIAIKYAGTDSVEYNGETVDGEPVDSAGRPFHGSISGTGYIYSTPYCSVEVNGLKPGIAYTGVVCAYDQLGPYPPGNITDEFSNQPIYRTGSKPPGAQTSVSSMSIQSMGGVVGPVPVFDHRTRAFVGWTQPKLMIGSNEGMTLDGNMTINGQGSYLNKPNELAESDQITLKSDGLVELPSGSDVKTYTFDTWQHPIKFGKPTKFSFAKDHLEYTADDAEADWNVLFDKADISASTFSQMACHVMPIVYDGQGATYSGSAVHQEDGYWAAKVTKPYVLHRGDILHLVYNVDATSTNRKKPAFFLSPANDPITVFNVGVGTPATLDNSGNALELRIESNTISGYNYGPDPGRNNISLTNSGEPCQTFLAANGGNTTVQGESKFDGKTPQIAEAVWRKVNGLGRDHKSKFDVFFASYPKLTENDPPSHCHILILENGVVEADTDFPGAANWQTSPTGVSIYFGLECYHTKQAQADDQNSAEPDAYDCSTNPIQIPDLSIDSGDPTLVTSKIHPFSSADILPFRQSIHITGQPYVYTITSVSDGYAKLSSSTGMGGQTVDAIESQNVPAVTTFGELYRREAHIGDLGAEIIPVSSVRFKAQTRRDVQGTTTWANMVPRAVRVAPGTYSAR